MNYSPQIGTSATETFNFEMLPDGKFSLPRMADAFHVVRTASLREDPEVYKAYCPEHSESDTLNSRVFLRPVESQVGSKDAWIHVIRSWYKRVFKNVDPLAGTTPLLGDSALIIYMANSYLDEGLSPAQCLFERLSELESAAKDMNQPELDIRVPSPNACADAREFISYLNLNAHSIMPIITFADDGEINFFWKNETLHIDLGFYGTGTYSYFAHGGDNKPLCGDDIPVSDGLAAEIEALLGD